MTQLPQHDPVALEAILGSAATVDITTSGRSSGLPRRIEIWMFLVDDRYIITGTPGPRDWYANVLANPDLKVHTGPPTNLDLEATAVPVDDLAFRRRVFTAPHTSWYRTQTPLEELVATSPMVFIDFAGDRAVGCD